jgi:hypothetical protein
VGGGREREAEAEASAAAAFLRRVRQGVEDENLRGGAVQVDPRLTPAWCQRLNLKYDDMVSNFAFNCNLRHYFEGAPVEWCDNPMVVRCRMTLL